MDEARGMDGGSDRRTFLKGVLMAGMAGAAGMATWWVTREGEPPAASMVAGATPPAASPTRRGGSGGTAAQPPAGAAGEAAEVRGLVDANPALRAELEALSSELTASKARVTELEAQLAAAEGQAGALGGLLALYRQLDELDLDEVVEGGLDALNFWVGQALSHLPGLRRGLATAERLLGQLEASLPSIEEGIGWLQAAVNRLADRLQVMEDALAETVEPLQPLAAKLVEFAGKILSWMPFGVGKGVERGLDGMAGLVTQIPELVRSVDGVVLAPLSRWFGGGEAQPAIQSGLIGPVKEEALRPAGRLAADVEVVERQLAKQLADPARERLSARRAVREEMGRYRGEYGL